jgi:molybdate transport system ATP-binding protein
MMLDSHLIVSRDGFHLDVALTAAPGETVALLGPNGAGKTTALRALAGLLPLSAGHVRLAGHEFDNPWVPAEHRPIGVVFQDYLLFPHLSALDNVAFGPRCRGLSRAEARSRASAWLERVGLRDLGGVKPRRLSGGQAQRVALARALAVEPLLLLLDEPLAALDARTRLDTRAELRRHLDAHSGVAVLVTHDPVDAMILADRIVIIEEGRVVQEGDAATITRHPRTDYVARLVGLNLYRGHAEGGVVTVPGGFALTVASPVTGEVFVAFPPTAVAVYRSQPDGSPRNVWPATVVGIERHGDNIRVELRGPIDATADITPAAVADLGLAPGSPLWASVKATETRAYRADTPV